MSSDDADTQTDTRRARTAPDDIDEPARVRAAVRAVRAGDREAFALILELYERRVFGLVLMLVRDPTAAEEVAQDAFVRAYTRLHRYDEHRPFYPWVATIAVRLAQNWLRRHGRVAARETALDTAPAQPRRDADPLDALIRDERSRRLWKSVAALPSGERAAVTLHYRQGMKVKDVAQALGVTAGTVKTFLFRARGKLRLLLEDPEIPSESTHVENNA